MSPAKRERFQIALAPGNNDGTTVVEAIIEAIMGAIASGDLSPGQRLNDAQLAEQLGVSRTPVREAFQRLRHLGIIEASASRFTRVAVLTPKQTADALIVWIALFAPLVDEVIPTAPESLYTAMQEHHESFRRGVETKDVRVAASSNVAFFHSPTQHSDNEALVYSLTALVHLVLLGGIRLSGEIDFSSILTSQEHMLEAVRTHNVELAHTAISTLRQVRVPGA
jgi:GntR family transcriptional regulator, rspAB operon transcriptional repressor